MLNEFQGHSLNKCHLSVDQLRPFFILLWIGKTQHSAISLEPVGDNGFLFQLPGKRPLGWTVQAKVDIYLWLGPTSYAHSAMEDLPVGYEIELPSNTNSGHNVLPSPACLLYKSKALFLPINKTNGHKNSSSVWHDPYIK